MTLDDDLFNVPENDEEMLDANEEEDDEDEDEEMNAKESEVQDNEEEKNEDEDDDNEEEEDEDDDEDDDDEEGEEEDDDDEEDDDGDEYGNADESKYIDAKETQNDDADTNDKDDGTAKTGSENVVDLEHQKTKENLLEQFRDDLREEEEKEKIKQEEEKEIQGSKEGEDNGNKDNGKDEADSMEIDGEDKQTSNVIGEDGLELSFREKIISQAKSATKFDIIPTVAIPYASQCHSIAFSEGPRWIITGGEDGFIRKYDFIASIEGKSPLTMAQKHNLVDTVTKAGVIVSYWENEQPQTKQQILKSNPRLKASDFAAGTANYEPKLSPVYSLETDRNGYWCLSGLSRGGIALYTMRYNEGSIHHYFMQGKRSESGLLSSGHSDTISVLKLNSEESKFLSGSWDKTIREWDLNTGQCSNVFLGLSGQISNIQYRPFGLSDMSISVETDDNNSSGAVSKSNGTNASGAGEKNEKEVGSDIDSLFGDEDEEEDEEKQRVKLETKDKSSPIPVMDSSSSTLHNKKYSNDSIFMSSSIDGTINIWDVRVSDQNGANSVIKLGVPANTPPWCMSSTWSNCGDYIYAGRRNSTVEEFSIKMPHKRASSTHAKGTVTPNVLKTLNFPKISGPISSLATMPNKDFLLCGSNDNIRLYNLSLYNGIENSNIQVTSKNKPATPFMIIPGHHGGILSALWLDETGRFMVSASGNRGWGQFNYTETVLLYEIDFE